MEHMRETLIIQQQRIQVHWGTMDPSALVCTV